MLKARLLVLTVSLAMLLTTWAATPGQAGPRAAQSASAAQIARAAQVAAQAATRVAPVVWGPCRERWMRRAGARCGVVTVPRDYADPTAGTVRLAVSRVQHTTRRSKGVMLTNAGGPGAPGLWMSTLGSLMPGNTGRAYDWIGFDPRGVGASRPRLACRPRYFHGDRPPYIPRGPATVTAWLTRTEAYADACARRNAGMLEHMRTIETVRDMNRIRAALGVRRVSFYGYSYGSYLGQIFATAYPHRLHRMVLDSNVDPAKVWYATAGPQIRAQQRVLDFFFAWIARHAEVYRLGRTAAAVRRTFLREQRDLLRRPARGVLGPSEFSDAFVPALYLQVAWPSVARAFARLARRNDPGPLIRIWRLGTRGSDNSYAAFLATYCTDAPGYDDPQRLLSDAARLARVAPQVAWANTWQTAPCLSWGADPGPRVVVEPRRVRALLVGQTLDGATPFADSLAVRAILPRSRLIAIRGGTTHGSTPDLSGRCANLWLAAYLRSGALPPRRPGRRADVTCPAPPPPRPGSAVAGQAPGSLMWLRLRN